MALPRQLPPRNGWTSSTSLERWRSHRILQAPTMEIQTYRTPQRVRHEIWTWTRLLGQKLTKGAALSKKHTMIMIPSRDGRGLANGNRRAAWLLFSNSKNRNTLSRCCRIPPIAATVEAPPRGYCRIGAARPTLSLQYLPSRFPLSLYS